MKSQLAWAHQIISSMKHRLGKRINFQTKLNIKCS